MKTFKLAVLASAVLSLQFGVDVQMSGASERKDPSFGSVAFSRVQPDYAGMADNFLTGLGTGSPALLGKYVKIRDELQGNGKLAVLGRFIQTGDVGAFVRSGLTAYSQDLIEATPVLGQMYGLANLGAQLGDWATQHYGSGRFDSLYKAAESRLGESDWKEGLNNDFVRALMVEGTKGGVTYSWLNSKTGVDRTRDENDKIIWQMLKAKHDFNLLADKYGLGADQRTYHELQKRIAQDIQTRAKKARDRERARLVAVRLKLARDAVARKKQAEKQKQRQAENAKFVCDVWLGRATDPSGYFSKENRPADNDIEELCHEKPTHEPRPVNADAGEDNDAGKDAVAEPSQAKSFAPRESSIQVDPRLAVSVVRTVVGAQTFCDVSVVNVSSRAISSLSLDVRASAPFQSGGVGAGGKKAGAGGLKPGQLVHYTVFAGGDAPGVTGYLAGAAKQFGQFTCFSAHTTHAGTVPEKIAGKNYAGEFVEGDPDIGGDIALQVSGDRITGTISKDIEMIVMMCNSHYKTTIKAQFSARLAAQTKRFSAQISGRETGRSWTEGNKGLCSAARDMVGQKIDNPVSGRISGTFGKGRFSGTLEFSVFGDDGSKTHTSGTWTANRARQ